MQYLGFGGDEGKSAQRHVSTGRRFSDGVRPLRLRRHLSFGFSVAAGHDATPHYGTSSDGPCRYAAHSSSRNCPGNIYRPRLAGYKTP